MRWEIPWRIAFWAGCGFARLAQRQNPPLCGHAQALEQKDSKLALLVSPQDVMNCGWCKGSKNPHHKIDVPAATKPL
jgi:hypothetical protein